MHDCIILSHPQEVEDCNKKSVPVHKDEPPAPLLDNLETKFNENGNMKAM